MSGRDDALFAAPLGGRLEIVAELPLATARFRRFRARDADGSRCIVDLIATEQLSNRWPCLMETMKELDHPRLVLPIEVGVDERLGVAFVVEAAARDGSLVERVAERGALPPAIVAAIGMELADCLAVLHDSGLALGSLEPGLVLVRDAGTTVELRLSGVAAALASRGEADVARDLREVGHVLHYAASGGAPRERELDAGDAVSDVISRLLSDEPGLRPASAVGLRAALAASVPGAPGARVGSVIDGRFTLVRVIGEGGMGVVYEAQTSAGEPVAIKLIRSPAVDSETRRRFLREARVAMELASPNVARVLASGEDDAGGMFMVMELLRGRDLAAWLKTHAPLAPRVAVRIAVEACHGVAAAHAAGLIHRDIKPSNLFLHEEGQTLVVKVCDFGLAKRALVADASGSLTQGGALLGSPGYMAPEQAREPRAVDARADVWALGMTLYECLSGQSAWGARANVGELLARLFGGKPLPLAGVAPWLPVKLTGVVDRALSRDPGQRFEDAAAFGRALEPFASAPPLRADAVQPLDPNVRGSTLPNPGNPARLKLAMALVACGVVAGTLAALRHTMRPRAPDQSSLTSSQGADDAACELQACIASHAGKPARCRADGACVALESDRCSVLAEPETIADPRTIWIGAMFPSGDKDAYMADLGRASVRAVDLARRDFMSVTGGLPAAGTGAKARPLGLIACDDSSDPRASAEHLATTVEVPAVIGFRDSNALIANANDLFIPHRVLAVAALNQSALIADLPHPKESPRLVWRIAAGTGSTARAVAAFLEQVVEPSIRRQLARPRDIRVLVVRSDNATGLGLGKGLYDALRFNGRNTSQNEASFREVAFDMNNASSPELIRALPMARAFQPDVVIAQLTSGALIDELVAPLEKARPPGENAPIYLSPASLEGPKLDALLRAVPTLRSRLFSTATATRTAANLRFTQHFNASFGEQYTPAISPGAPYDSFYLVAFAAYAAGAAEHGEIHGDDLGRAIARLVPPGRKIEVGPSTLLEGMGVLRRGETLDLAGAFSRMDFDLRTGDSTADFELLCASPGERPGTFVPRETGLSYDAGSTRVEGTLSCPSGP